VKEIVNGVRSRLGAYLRGWRTAQKIVVIESDDWGSIRTSSRAAYDRLVEQDYQMNRSPYSFDALETNEDLESLFEILNSVRDCGGRPACLTANMIMANPDFERIREDGFQTYYYKPVSATLAELSERQGVEGLWAEGFGKKLFVPQFHGREHVCWWEWLRALRNQEKEAVETFSLRMCGVPLASSRERRSFFTPLFLRESVIKQYGVDLSEVMKAGVSLFEDQFNFRPLSAVAPNVTWTDQTEKIWSSIGIRYFQGGLVQYLDYPVTKKRFHFLGERNKDSQYYLVRNCTFEPSRSSDRRQQIERCLGEIRLAFAFGKPAVISSHRVNYIGSINRQNRQRGLEELGTLLHDVCDRWPDVYFLSTPELGCMIEFNLSVIKQLMGKDGLIYPPALSKHD
jgi:hypothetical protein